MCIHCEECRIKAEDTICNICKDRPAASKGGSCAVCAGDIVEFDVEHELTPLGD